MKKTGLLSSTLAILFIAPTFSSAAVLYTQTVNLQTGWNIVSTPKVLDSHSFSAAETSANFDIYVLDASQTSGWATMAALGQTEFIPLYGYFINNKTGSTQTLTFNYKSGTQPNERLFSRTFTATGWYSVGVANPTYALAQGVATTTDNNNPSDILFSLRDYYSQILDFTVDAFSSNTDSVKVGDTWSARTYNDRNLTNDFRETKAYSLYINVANSLYSGFQDNTIYICNDGIDNDSDGLIDYGVDPGCSNANYGEESNVPGALSVSVSSSPVAQNIIAGVQGFTFANVQLDASQSGEDVRINSISLTENGSSHAFAGAHNKLSTCQLYDGATALNGGGNVVSGDSVATTTTATQASTFTLDNSLTIPKGTVKTLALKCNVATTADSNSRFQWGIASAQITALSVTGVTSGSTITATGTAANGPLMTVSSAGTLTATASGTAVAQPALARVVAGTTGVTMGSVKFSATNEDIQLQKIGLTLTNGVTGSASQGAGGNSGHVANDNVTTAYIYNGATLVGQVTFTGTTATSTLSTPVNVPANGNVTLTIKADLANVGTNLPGGIGDTVKVDPLNAQGLGLASSQQVNISATAGVNGVQMFMSVPTVALGTGACTGTGCNGTNQVIKSINVTANTAGPISVRQLIFDIATSSATLDTANVVVYDQSGNVASSTFGASIDGDAMASGPSLVYTGGPVIIPAGATYNFKLTATVTPGSTATNWSVNTTLQGDSAAIAGLGSSPITIGTTTAVAQADGQEGFIWSDNATTTAGLTDVDWFNGFQVSGLSANGI